MINMKINCGFKTIILGALFLVSFIGSLHGKDMFSPEEIHHVQDCAELTLDLLRGMFAMRNLDEKPITDRTVMSWIVQMVEFQQLCLEKNPKWKKMIGGKRHLAYRNADISMNRLLHEINECRSKKLENEVAGKEDLCPAMVIMKMLAVSDNEKARQALQQRLQRLQRCDGIKDVEEAIWR